MNSFSENSNMDRTVGKGRVVTNSSSQTPQDLIVLPGPRLSVRTNEAQAERAVDRLDDS